MFWIVSKWKLVVNTSFSFLSYKLASPQEHLYCVDTSPKHKGVLFSPCRRSESEAPQATPPLLFLAEPAEEGSLVAFSPATGVFTRDLHAELFKGSLPPLKEGQGPFIIKLLFHSGARPHSIIQWQYRTWRGVNTSFANAERRGG